MIGMQIHMASLNRLFYSYTWTRKNNQSDSKLPEIFIVEQLNSSSFPFGRPLNGTVFSGTQFFGSNISFELQISLEHMELPNPLEKRFPLQCTDAQRTLPHCKFWKFLHWPKCVLCTAKGGKICSARANSEFKIQFNLNVFAMTTFGHVQRVSNSNIQNWKDKIENVKIESSCSSFSCSCIVNHVSRGREGVQEKYQHASIKRQTE